ncbi:MULTISPECIES: DUF2846 domain-containing protein [Shewanella]|uniref:DUF2846 domain-containing protein n=1 Tax=Shewanella TaxID=22 RepID=UPI002043C2A9|nr:DUF2846 domain-containing protein [Shewanella indica]
MKFKLLLIFCVSMLFAGCASVPTESTEVTNKAKQFTTPSDGHAGLYIYRHGNLGGALKKDLFVDGDCIGETAPNIFFYHEVKGGQKHTISTESEFSPNDLVLETETGRNYFIKQYIKLGVFVGGAGLEHVEDKKGKEVVTKLDMAKKGRCSK